MVCMSIYIRERERGGEGGSGRGIGRGIEVEEEEGESEKKGEFLDSKNIYSLTEEIQVNSFDLTVSSVTEVPWN